MYIITTNSISIVRRKCNGEVNLEKVNLRRPGPNVVDEPMKVWRPNMYTYKHTYSRWIIILLVCTNCWLQKKLTLGQRATRQPQLQRNRRQSLHQQQQPSFLPIRARESRAKMAAQRECKTASANVSVRPSGRGRTAKVSDNLYINNRLVNKCMPTHLNANANVQHCKQMHDNAFECKWKCFT